jgi:hypothetical protein
MLYSNKRLQNTKRYKEYQDLSESYYRLSLQKEANQQNFLKNIHLLNSASGEVLKLNHSFEKYYNKYTKSIEQKVYAIEQIAKDKKLTPVFITLTLPSTFHPFKSIEYKGKRLYTSLNKEFGFKSFNEAIKNGYEYLSLIYRTFYKRVKNSVDSLLYVKVVEVHKTFLPHFHILFYVEKSEIKIIKKIFDKINIEFSLAQSDFEVIKTNINRASKYILKYVLKSLNSNEDYYKARLIDGWKRQYKIRMITMSNLDLSLYEFRTIYYGLDKEHKTKLLLEAKKKKVNIFYLILQSIFKAKIVKKTNKTILKQVGDFAKAKFYIFQTITKLKSTNGGYRDINDNFTFFMDKKLILVKQKYIMRRVENEY